MDCPTPHKIKHSSKEAAEAALSRAWRTGMNKHLPLRVYKCECKRWHLTSKSVKWWLHEETA